MADLTLLRVGCSDTLTQGVLRQGPVAFAVTLELPWRENEPNRSCIPVGTYTCQRVKSPRFGETFEITGVPDRSHILFHRGNTIADTAGCILVGEKFTDLAIGESGAGYAEFMGKFVGVDTFTLDVLAA